MNRMAFKDSVGGDEIIAAPPERHRDGRVFRLARPDAGRETDSEEACSRRSSS